MSRRFSGIFLKPDCLAFYSNPAAKACFGPSRCLLFNAGLQNNKPIKLLAVGIKPAAIDLHNIILIIQSIGA
ncbi:MAG TPA: hypothetical protein DCP97_03155 [Ruminococcaceae bacterium]|nr:hypothetical protein [Oscillospiraceae bacterium]